ncbi:MAG: hypothetical protein IH851_00720 [Armatimonadetes bacterium]|nr:hypothetical protein [Armatimonadota bacterium]
MDWPTFWAEIAPSLVGALAVIASLVTSVYVMRNQLRATERAMLAEREKTVAILRAERQKLMSEYHRQLRARQISAMDALAVPLSNMVYYVLDRTEVRLAPDAPEHHDYPYLELWNGWEELFLKYRQKSGENYHVLLPDTINHIESAVIELQGLIGELSSIHSDFLSDCGPYQEARFNDIAQKVWGIRNRLLERAWRDLHLNELDAASQQIMGEELSAADIEFALPRPKPEPQAGGN